MRHKACDLKLELLPLLCVSSNTCRYLRAVCKPSRMNPAIIANSYFVFFSFTDSETDTSTADLIISEQGQQLVMNRLHADYHWEWLMVLASRIDGEPVGVLAEPGAERPSFEVTRGPSRIRTRGWTCGVQYAYTHARDCLECLTAMHRFDVWQWKRTYAYIGCWLLCWENWVYHMITEALNTWNALTICDIKRATWCALSTFIPVYTEKIPVFLIAFVIQGAKDCY